MPVSIAIKKAKQIIDNGGFVGEGYKGYQPVYFVTNENIDSYLQFVNFKNKHSALTVLSSGDHAFSLATKGITYIDTFDINILQKYIALGLKRAIIEKYNYEEFMNNIGKLVSNCSLENVSSIIYDLLPLMDTEYRIFWQNVIDYYYIVQKERHMPQNLIQILCRQEPHIPKYKERVSFLKSEGEYNKLRNVIGKINITFKNIDAINLGNVYAGNKYDFILLSNILNYLSQFQTSELLIQYINSLEFMTKKDGIIFLKYLYFQYAGDVTQKYVNNYYPFDKLSFPQVCEQNILIKNLENRNNLGEGGMIFKRIKD